ncbi:MAG: 2-C-methyl-D-erythritol 4-phosphate cytidylyltransferase [Coriobacteriales bacterium]|nr:2-C-methyl-D-erythritol 4-phosphate cytidylyltransferase [Coriobacteriales bacterium]
MSAVSACACARVQRVGEAASGADACAIIVAGGSGERFGDPRGKQFVELMGLPLVAWSILAFDHAPSVAHVVVVCPQDKQDQMRESVLAKLELRKKISLVPGGARRQDSVFAGLLASPPELALVAIHDGARPLIEVEAIESCLAAVRSGKTAGQEPKVDGAICAERVTDTLKAVDEAGLIVGTPSREHLWGAQTPQSFCRDVIISAHEAALLDGYTGTDDASLVERRGGCVRVVESSRDNIKVTVPEDLAIATAILRSRLGLE